ncbi:MAG: insulinase family protein [Candidatus Rokubacteria bacterium]|nr:insulinase family protein [Candidatus Rokubacteria bacterium]
MLASRVPAGLVLALLLVLGAASGCAVVSDGREGRGAGGGDLPRPTREVLPNGVVMIVQPHRASDVVALQLWMRVGGRDEAPDDLGLSHYLEHMLFKGTASRPPGSIDRMIEGFGGASNAFTSYDYTHYDVVLPAEHVRSGIELLADIAVNASFPPEEIDGERQVVFEEMRLLEDDTDRFLVRRLYETAYAEHPYGRPILGPRPLIETLTRERLDRYYKKLYAPANMTIVVVGAVTPRQVRPVVAATFGRLAARPAPRATVAPSVPDGARRSVSVDRAEKQAYLGLAWKAAPISGADVLAVDLLTYILGDSPSSRLNLAVRERDRLVFTIESGYGAWEKGGLVTVTARLDPVNLDRAERSILDVIRRVQAEGVTETERQRAIITAESAYAFDIETAEGLAKAYGQAETTWNLDGELGYLAKLRQITAAEIQAAARKYFGTDAMPYSARVRFVPR